MEWLLLLVLAAVEAVTAVVGGGGGGGFCGHGGGRVSMFFGVDDRACQPRCFLHLLRHHHRHRYFLVTHFADRGSLEQYVEKPFGTEQGDGGVPLRRRLSWTRQIALALHYIHRENFVHRAFLCVPARTPPARTSSG